MLNMTLIARIILGLIYFVFGLNGFLQFMPMPELTEEGAALMGALAATGCFFPVLELVEVVSGALLLLGRFVPLALVLLAPISIQICLFHISIEPAGLPMAILILLLQAYLGFVSYRHSFVGVLSATQKR